MDIDINNLQELNEFEHAMLNDEDFFNKFIEDCEKSVLTAPENLASSVMAKINTKNHRNIIPLMSRKMRAVACFCGAFVIMASTLFGLNDKIFNFISNVTLPDKIEKISEFLNILSKFKFN